MNIIDDLERRFTKIRVNLKNGVIVLFGGDSSEIAASLLTGKNVFDVLVSSGLKAELVDPSKIDVLSLVTKLSSSSLVFNALHGGRGEDGTIQGFLDYCGVPYTGSGVEGSAIGKNKLTCKRIWRSVGIATPKYLVLKDNKREFIGECGVSLGWPFVIKIPNEGSGQGVFLVKTVIQALMVLNKFTEVKEIFAEKYIGGKELSTIVIKNKGSLIASPVLEEKNGESFMDSTLKDTNILVRTIPANLPLKIVEVIRQKSIEAFEMLNCRDYARFDIRLSRNNVPYFLEVTTLPSIKTNSRLPVIFQSMGLSFDQIVQLLVCIAVERRNIDILDK